MLSPRERYQLMVYHRFSDLESEAGKGPAKLVLRQLRKVRSWPSCALDDDVVVDGTGDGPSVPEIEAGTEVVGRNGLNTNDKETKTPYRSPGHASSYFSDNSQRKVDYGGVTSRREKRAVREREYTSRRLGELRRLADDRNRLLKSESQLESTRVENARRSVRAAQVGIDRLEDLAFNVHEPVRGLGVEIRPPPELTVSVPRVGYSALPRGYLASRDGPLTVGPHNCGVRYGCRRPRGHKGLCDVAHMCPHKTYGASCCMLRGHPGDHRLVGWTCPECSVPFRRPHMRGCTVRLARNRSARAAPRGTGL